MKVIDLLNKIANGEEPPKKIKRNEIIFTLEDDIDYVNENKRFLMGDIICTNKDDLNSEIEIIEEPKEKEGFVTNGHRFVQNENGVSVLPIEEDKEIKGMVINNECLFSNSQSGKMRKADRRLLDSNFKEIADKFNEFAKVINELKKGK